MKLINALALVFLFSGAHAFGQVDHLYKLEAELMKGDKEALFKIAGYFDSGKPVIEYLGYHRIETVESLVAKRIVRENSVFARHEFTIAPGTSAGEFLNFLKINKNKIAFSPVADAFILSPLEAREVEFKVLELSAERKKELAAKADGMLKPEWAQQSGIEYLVQAKDPAALFRIASLLYKNRDRYNRYNFKKEEYTDLLQYLTGAAIAVKNEKNEFSYHVGKDFYPDSQLNLLIFFARHYRNYRWDAENSVFVNPNLTLEMPSPERGLFEQLKSETDETAFNAFIRLTTANPKQIDALAEEFQKAGIDANSALPIFPYRFLKQLVLLTSYAREKGIDFRGSAQLRAKIEKLKEDLPFAEAYRLENELIETLTLDDVTAFEYWALIYSSDWQLNYSAGRILDKFYSRNRLNLIGNEKHLKLYLKKSKIYAQIGVIGVCNKFLNKFAAAPQTVLVQIKNIKNPDDELKERIEEIVKLNNSERKAAQPAGDTEMNFQPPSDLEKRLAAFVSEKPLSDARETELVELISQISYEQIGTAMEFLERINYETSPVRSKFDFVPDDWGFSLAGEFGEEAVRKEFLANYSKMSPARLYAYYLDKNKFDYRNSDQSLDFDKIYEMLKYDIVEAFAGGGGGRRERHVYPLVKLLESEFKTTLGFPGKLCRSRHIYYCSSDDRAEAWMKFLSENGHLKTKRDEPPSFSLK